jgi:hypothetical protein
MNSLAFSTIARKTFENDGSQERRTQERLKISLPVHVSSIEPSEHPIVEAATTLDLNRHGLCFKSRREHYCVGTTLSLSFPYSSPLMVRKEFVGEVIRVDSLPNGGYSVAVRFLPNPQPETY